MTEKRRPHVVIVGAGFAGVKTAQLLAKENVDITVVDRNNFHLFQPLLYQLSTSELDEGEIAYPIRVFFRNAKNVNFYMAHATDFDPKNKILKTDKGDLSYDYLVLAAGATTNFFGMKSVEENALGMKTLQEAIALRNHLLRMFEKASKCKDSAERRRMLTFVCVGGGPTGVESAGAISELIYNVLTKEYHGLDFSEVRVLLIEAMDNVLAMMPPSLQEETVRVLKNRCNVDVRVRTQVTDYDGRNISLKDGSVIPTYTVIWAAGVKAVSFLKNLGTETDRAGRLVVTDTLQIKEYPEIYAIGDCAHFLQDGRPLATIAPVAMQQASVCAENIKRAMQGQTKLQTFRYKDVGAMAIICRCHAVVSVNDFKMTGFFAWCAWLVVHIVRLTGAISNMTVLYKWIWNFLFGLRLGRTIDDTRLKN